MDSSLGMQSPAAAPRRRMPLAVRLLAAGFVLLAGATLAIGWLGYQRYASLANRVAMLETEVATTTSKLQAGIAETQNTLASKIDEQHAQTVALQNQFGSVQQKFGNLTGTVSDLQKMSTLDPELLKKYSKVYFLNENYMPASLSDLDPKYGYSNTKTYSVLTPVLPDLVDMLDAATQQGVTMYVASAYRSFGEQSALKGEYSVIYGAGTAGQFSADQGYSEHQLGTAVDLITTGLGGDLTTAFAKTPAYQWLQDNAYKYGFILSYPQGNSYYQFEPWHWRFVGIKLATYLHNNHENFYDMDQRQIDTYLPSIFD